MIEPITMTKYNEILDVPQRSKLDRMFDEACLTTLVAIGTHRFCEGFVDLKQVSEEWNVLHCVGCGLRIIVPIEIRTYGQLRKYLNIRREPMEILRRWG